MKQLAPPQVRHVPSVRDLILRGLLALAVLVPVTVLFGQVWSAKSDQASTIAQERKGVTYLRALIPLTEALAYAESVAVNGDKVDFEAVNQALAAVAVVDRSPGVSGGTHDRFVGLNTKIQQLQAHAVTSPLDAYNTFSAVTALALALAEEVRLESSLIRDPEADVFYLEDGAGRQMLTSLVAAGQYGDLVAIAIGQPANVRQNTIGEIAAARAVILNAATTLGADVQNAVDAKPSETLSGTLPTKLDQFRLAIDAMVPVDALPNQLPSDIDRSSALTDKAKVQTAATALSGAMLDAIESLLAQRADAIRHDEELAVGSLLIAVLLASLPLLAGLYRRRRAHRDLAAGPSGARPASSGSGGGAGFPGPLTGPGEALPRREGTRARELRELSSAPR